MKIFKVDKLKPHWSPYSRNNRMSTQFANISCEILIPAIITTM